MGVQERELHELHNGLEEVLGAERAATLMSRLTPVPWPESATKSDLMATRSELKSEVAAVRSEIKALGQALRLEMVNLELRMEAQGDRLRAEMSSQFAKQTWTLVVAFVMALVSVAGMVLGVR